MSCTIPNIDFFLLNYDLFCPNWSYQDKLPECTPSILMENCGHTICPIPGIFEKFFCELEASYSFKITCIQVRQVIPLKKIGGVISKIYCLVSWSPICTPLILLSALMKMVSISTTVIYNSMKVDTPDELLIQG